MFDACTVARDVFMQHNHTASQHHKHIAFETTSNIHKRSKGNATELQPHRMCVVWLAQGPHQNGIYGSAGVEARLVHFAHHIAYIARRVNRQRQFYLFGFRLQQDGCRQTDTISGIPHNGKLAVSRVHLFRSAPFASHPTMVRVSGMYDYTVKGTPWITLPLLIALHRRVGQPPRSLPDGRQVNCGPSQLRIKSGQVASCHVRRLQPARHSWCIRLETLVTVHKPPVSCPYI